MTTVQPSDMIIVAGSTLALIASILVFHKPRNRIMFILNALIYEIKYNALGARELVKDHVYARYNKTDLPRKSGKIAIVTGGSRGIGSTVVKMLLQCDMEVIVACRNCNAGHDAIRRIRECGVTSGSAKVYELDNSSFESVRKFAREIRKDYKKIDVLVNNAGIMFTPYSLTKDGFEKQWAVNYLSHFLLTSLLLPVLASAGTSSERARVINVSSCAHNAGEIDCDDTDCSKGFITKLAYARSKLAQVMFTKTIQDLFSARKMHIQSYAVHPGIVNTDLFQHTLFKHFKLILKLVFKTPEQGATPIVFAAVNKSIENKGGIYVADCLETPVNPQALDSSTRDRLFKLSLEQVKLTDFFES